MIAKVLPIPCAEKKSYFAQMHNHVLERKVRNVR